MNKKFSTLVACALLATSVGAYAGDYSPSSTAPVKYEAGKSYLLKVGTGDEYLTVIAGSKTASPRLAVKALTDAASLLDLQKASWEVKVTPAEAGAISPKFVLTNRYTGTILALDKSMALEDLSKYADSNSVMGGDIIEWLVETPTATPQENTFYVSYGKDDKVVVLAYDEKDTNTAGKEVFAQILPATKISDGSVSKAIDFTPVLAGAEVALTANDLNTQFGVNGALVGSEIRATKNNFFKLDINPAVSEGQINVFGTELQARAVERHEIQYGTEDVVLDGVAGENDFISMYPEGTKNEAETSFRSDETVVALYSKVKDQYVVVDTFYVPGTEQVGNALIKFGYDNLYNAKALSKYRLPESYLFKFMYNVTNNTITVKSEGYVTKNAGNKQQVKATTDNAAFYAGSAADVANNTDATNDYGTAPVKIGSQWAAGDYTNAADGPVAVAVVTAENSLTYARLDKTVVLTLGDVVEDDFSVKVGVQSSYQLTNMSTGAYLFKVVGVADATKKDNVGKYMKLSLDGTFEYVEEAIRQNFQHMPSAQWIVQTTGTSSSYAPIKITNREFGSAYFNSGLIYTAGNNKIFFFGGDTLEYTPVAEPKKAELGYKYISDDEMNEAVYSFNYLHDLAMDKPINTKSDKDSVVWVDKEGNSMMFQLEKVAEDTYGYNGGLNSVSQLKRLVYKVRVKDASKLQNDGRYLTYNEDLKKYVITKDQAPAIFFLKENNEVKDAECYYTLVNASVLNYTEDADYGWVPAKLTYAVGTTKDNVFATIEVKGSKAIVVKDADVKNYVFAKKEKALDEDGLLTKDVWVPVAQTLNFTPAASDMRYASVGGKWYSINSNTAINYATDKVSVDNNTLDLVNGNLYDAFYGEVANSAFAVKKDDSKLYRTIGDVEGENAKESVLNFFRVNSTAKEYLYEDANSAYSKGLGMNFLGVEGKGDAKNTAMLVKYTHGTKMPQYLIALDTTVFAGTEYICPECGLTTCEHSKSEEAYVDGRFLINLIDSVNYYDAADNVAIKNKYQWNKIYNRLAFVDARLMGDSLIIKNSVYTGNNSQIKLDKPTTVASKDTINLAPNQHNSVLFSFRLINDTNNFMIESESWKDNAFDGGIAPQGDKKGGWVKIQNGVPVIVNTTFETAYNQAEIFNVETTDKAATSNEGIEANAVSVTADFGKVIIKNAEGKIVAISNILGQAIANTVITSDNATIAVPAGIVVVSVEGEEAVKVIVK